jgi:MFS family permease
LGTIVVASNIGFTIETYDFLIYGFLAAVIAKVLFPPAGDPMLPFITALLVFAVGFFFRPLGGLIFGYVGDKYGRKIAFIITLLLMGIACLGIGLLPTYAEVGILATILLVLFRILQGIAYGGEGGPAIVFLLEHAPPHRRGLYVSFITSAWLLGPLLAAITLYVNAIILGPEALEAWGWRIPFLVGVALVGIGIIMRLWVEETPVFKQYKSKGEVFKNPVVVSFKRLWKLILLFTVLIGATSIMYYTTMITSFSTFWLVVKKIPVAIAAFAFIFIYLIGAIAMWTIGYFSDKIGRRPFYLWPLILGGIVLVPLYSLFFTTNDIFVLAIASLIPVVLMSIFACAGTIIINEMIPANVRATSFGMSYQLGLAALGGLTPFIITALFYVTGNLLAALSFVVAFQFIAAILIWLFIPETKGADIAKTLKI